VEAYDHRANTSFQEVVVLRERDWEALPPPPVIATGKPKPADVDQNNSGATPIVPSWDFPAEISSLAFLIPLHSNRSPPQR